MAFPRVKYCIVCDLVRGEEAGKVSILGFLGIMPDVAILAQDIRQPVGLTFLFVLLGPPTGTNQVSFDVSDAAGRVLTKTLETTMEGPPPGTPGMGMVAMPIPALYGSPGRYRARLYVNGKVHWTEEYSVDERPTATGLIGHTR